MDSLHSIIQSLNRTEKRYFKLFASQFKADSQLVRLFDAFYESEEYDESKLKKTVGASNLLPAKSALRKLLFKAMRNYREDASVQQKLRNDISDIDFLLRKGLLEEATKEIKKARKAAEKNAAYNYLSELVIYSARASTTVQREDSIINYFKDIEAQYDRAVLNQSQLHKALLINYHLTGFMATNSYLEPNVASEHVNSLTRQSQDLLEVAESPFARIMLLSTIAFGQPHASKSLARYEEIRKLYRANPELVTVNPQLYMALLSNYTLLAAANKEYRRVARQLFIELEKGFSALDFFFKYYPDRVLYLRGRLTSNKLYYSRANNDWSMLEMLEEEVRHYRANKRAAEPTLNAIHSAMLISCFYHQKNYDKTLEWVGNYYALNRVKALKTFMICVRLYEVLGFYQKKQFDMSDNRAVNLYKTLLEQKFTADYYKYMGIMLRKLNHWDLKKADDRNEIKKLISSFEALKEQEDPFHILYRGYFQPEEILKEILG
ncbi:MAG: hypothetical protein JWO06_903 [Bacteroidota bacterium]|nr:hypothetical protein [Bacteroidota bacterium]